MKSLKNERGRWEEEFHLREYHPHLNFEGGVPCLMAWGREGTSRGELKCLKAAIAGLSLFIEDKIGQV